MGSNIKEKGKTGLDGVTLAACWEAKYEIMAGYQKRKQWSNGH